jgi:hypothetical protein
MNGFKDGRCLAVKMPYSTIGSTIMVSSKNSLNKKIAWAGPVFFDMDIINILIKI